MENQVQEQLMPERVTFEITVDLDGVPGSFHTTKSWLKWFARDTTIPPWYNPEVKLKEEVKN